jgi:hypothetical protein
VRRGLRRRYGRSCERDCRWSRLTRAWWSRAERVAPRETMVYRRARGTLGARRALERLKEAMS